MHSTINARSDQLWLVIGISVACLFSVALIVILSSIPLYLHNRSIPISSVQNKFDPSSRHIAIIGAGISGLNAALSLIDANLFSPKNIFIYEANNYVGGRIHTHHWVSENQTSEWCGEFLDSNYDVMLNLTKRFNISLIDTIATNNPEIYETTLYFSQRFYNTSQAWIDYQSVDGIIKEQLALIGDINYRESNSHGRFFDQMSLYEWIERYVPNGHRSQLGQYLDSAYEQEFGLDTHEQNCLSFLFKIDPYSQPPDGPLSIYGSSDQRYRIQGGNYLLPKRIAEYLQAQKVNIKLQYNLTKIGVTKSQRIALDFANGERQLFDHVILTLPISILRSIDYSQAQFDSLKQRMSQELRYATHTKINLQFSKRLWLERSSNGYIYTDLPFLNSWEASTGQLGETGLLVLFTGGTKGTSFAPNQGFEVFSQSRTKTSVNSYIDNFLKDVDEVWSNASSYFTGQGTISAPWIDPLLRGSYPCYTRGQYALFRGYEKQRQKNIHFAGDYTSKTHFGFMEGAAAEGYRVAREILQDYVF